MFDSESICPIQHSVLNRFADVDGADDFGRFEIGDGAGYLEDAGVGSGREAEAPEG